MTERNTAPLTIRNGLPCPPSRSPAHGSGRFAAAARAMNVDDYVLFDKMSDASHLATAIRKAHGHNGTKVAAVRKLSDSEFGCWRIA